MAMTPPDLLAVWQEICALTWRDEEFKRRLKADPEVELRERGIEPPPGVHFDVVENAPRQMYLVLPAPPSEVEALAGVGKRDGEPVLRQVRVILSRPRGLLGLRDCVDLAGTPPHPPATGETEHGAGRDLRCQSLAT